MTPAALGASELLPAWMPPYDNLERIAFMIAATGLQFWAGIACGKTVAHMTIM
jgi:hypothetical protein